MLITTDESSIKTMTPTPPEKYNWSRLNRLQLGKFAEYLVKMEFVLYGCDVFSSEVDDHGIDFVIRTKAGNHFDVQVKSFRVIPGKNTPYVFLEKQKFQIHSSRLLVLVHFVINQPPTLYLLPSSVNGEPNPLFVSRDYGEGRQSAPEWGMTLSKRNIERLSQESAFHIVVDTLI